MLPTYFCLQLHRRENGCWTFELPRQVAIAFNSPEKWLSWIECDELHRRRGGLSRKHLSKCSSSRRMSQFKCTYQLMEVLLKCSFRGGRSKLLENIFLIILDIASSSFFSFILKAQLQYTQQTQMDEFHSPSTAESIKHSASHFFQNV